MSRKNYKEEIINSAKTLLISKGYEALSMREVAKLAGIKAASIYNHFSSKDEIIFELILIGRKLLADEIRNMLSKAESVNDYPELFFKGFIKFGFENPEMYKIIFMTSFPDEAMKNVKEQISREIEPGLNTLAKLINQITKKNFEESLTIAESMFHIVHGHISLSILNRFDFQFNVEKTQMKIWEIIKYYIENLIVK